MLLIPFITEATRELQVLGLDGHSFGLISADLTAHEHLERIKVIERVRAVHRREAASTHFCPHLTERGDVVKQGSKAVQRKIMLWIWAG